MKEHEKILKEVNESLKESEGKPEKPEMGFKLTKDSVYMIAGGILIAMIIVLTVQNQQIIGRYNNLAEDYNKCVEPLISLQNTPQINEEYSLIEPVLIDDNETNQTS